VPETWCGLAQCAFGESLESGGRFHVDAFGRSLTSVAVKMFPHLIYFEKKIYEWCTFNAICKDNAILKSIRPTVQRKNTPFR
jgi:hypothetical protein